MQAHQAKEIAESSTEKVILTHSQEPLTAAMLANAPKNEQKQMLGERLFPLIKKVYPDQAEKITGMLLEMDNLELLNMLTSKELLEAKVCSRFINMNKRPTYLIECLLQLKYLTQSRMLLL